MPKGGQGTDGSQMNTYPWLSPYLALLAKILETGVKNPDYFRERCGRFWASVGGLDPAALWGKAEKLLWERRLEHADAPIPEPLVYRPVRKCSDPYAWRGVSPKSMANLVQGTKENNPLSKQRAQQKEEAA